MSEKNSIDGTFRTAASHDEPIPSKQEVCGDDTVESSQQKAGVGVEKTGHNLPC